MKRAQKDNPNVKTINKNMVFLAVLLAIAAIVGLVEGLGQPGPMARVDVVDSKTQYIDLERDGTYPVWEGKLTVILEVQDGRIHFKQSECPDQICVNAGWLENVGDTATCMPAGVSVTIEPPEE